jgi:hypothetical protein
MEHQHQQSIDARAVVKALGEGGERAIDALTEHPELLARLGKIIPPDLFQHREPILDQLSLSADVSMKLAASIVESYRFDRISGRSTCVIPSGITYEQAIHALAQLAENLYPRVFDASFMAENFRTLLSGPAEFSEYLLSPSLIKDRAIVQICVVGSEDCKNSLEPRDGKRRDSTIGKNRPEQSRILEKLQLDFSDPRDTIICVLSHACKNDGDILLERWNVRCSIPGWALTFINTCGVTFTRCFDDTGKHAAASGTPRQSMELSNL